VWSYGVVLWEMLTGLVPYDGMESMAVAYGVGRGKLTLPVPENSPNALGQLMTQVKSPSLTLALTSLFHAHSFTRSARPPAHTQSRIHLHTFAAHSAGRPSRTTALRSTASFLFCDRVLSTGSRPRHATR
jgi:serine/threonine protein kinase